MSIPHRRHFVRVCALIAVLCFASTAAVFGAHTRETDGQGPPTGSSFVLHPCLAARNAATRMTSMSDSTIRDVTTIGETQRTSRYTDVADFAAAWAAVSGYAEDTDPILAATPKELDACRSMYPHCAAFVDASFDLMENLDHLRQARTSFQAYSVHDPDHTGTVPMWNQNMDRTFATFQTQANKTEAAAATATETQCSP